MEMYAVFREMEIVDYQIASSQRGCFVSGINLSLK